MGLILTRREGESIFINGDSIKIKLMHINFNLNRVSLEITAPEEMSIHREEVYERIFAEGHKSKEELAVEKQDTIGNK